MRTVRVLMVDEDQKSARLMARGFQEEGFVVDSAGSAEEAEELTSLTHYQLIVLDWMLPGKDGLSLCRALRHRGVQTPILMLTVRGELSDRVDGLNSGVNDYLTKPFAFRVARARVRCCVGRRFPVRPC